ncbi:MAG: hypothetical protein K9M99_09525 [Candidatus Cloacimonetes bacterium]|nr:hypothetical protein [Candidatus Cloacimonadota bacterium]
MEIKRLKEFCNSHLVQTLDRRFNFETQRSISLKSETRKAVQKAITGLILIIGLIILPAPEGDPRYLAARIVIGVFIFFQAIGVAAFVHKFVTFNKPRTLDTIQAFYSSIFLQTTDKYRTTPRDRNRSLKKALLDNVELFPYPLLNYFIKDGYATYLREWNEVLRSYPLWKINIMAIRMMFTNLSVGKIRIIKVEIDYRIEEALKTFVIYNAVIEIKGIFFLVSPFPYTDED